ncbi:MAG TPA: EAL domain-containing protein [Gammaproteobacteria bacterium]|jgi:diguanylate cyclase (GGDEF)-like protein|nr:EAL domain-containing protein [Gammaproteobacteria bacterium]
MKLRNKVLIAITLAWVVFLIITYVGSQTFLLQSFLKLEHERASENLVRMDQALDQKNYSLYTFTADWSHWNDLYDYMQGKNPAFVPNNLNMTAFQNSTINLMTFWDANGKLKTGTSVNTDEGKILAYPEGIEKYLYPNSLLLDRKDVQKDVRGYILLPSGIMLIAATSITDGDKVKAPIGAMVNGRYLSDKVIKKIEEETRLNITLLLPKDIEKNENYLKAYNVAKNNDSGHFDEPINEDNIQGFSIIRDIYKKPIGMLRFESTRSIYTTGLRAIHYYLVLFLIVGIIFSLLLVGLLRSLIVRRLEHLDNEVAEISEKNELNRRVDARGSDEISSVAHQINSMMDIIESSHEQLENRVRERTQELQKTNIQLEQEIAERKSVEKDLLIHKEHLARLAHYDELTGLPNRVFFSEILNKTIIHSRENHKRFALFFIDLDRFKKINDALGHPTGDLVLKEFAEVFKNTLRKGDILARLGGDEFVILLNEVSDTKIIATVAENIFKACAKPIKIRSHEFFITASIGICIYPNDGASLEDLLKNADMAMYKAKRAGGGVYQYYTEEMNLEASAYIELESKLRKAILNNEFILHYQPKYTIKDGQICGVEVLIRWESPEQGLIMPEKFIPIAEETGLIMQIGEWVLREACKTNKTWQDQGFNPVSIAVNVSAKQFKHQDLIKLVQDVLQETGMAAEYLELEITETAIMENVESAITKLIAIEKMGVKVSIDDFGTGYTSISYLKQFPISILKIDKSFIKGIPLNQNDNAIASGVIALAHSLGLLVVAEGVETNEQLQYLAEHNCDIVQGYYLSKPLSNAKITIEFNKIKNLANETIT